MKKFFQFPGKFNMRNTTQKEYTGRKLVGFSMENIYDVVSDVEEYKRFLPFCKQSQVTWRSEDRMLANLVIGFPPIIESYTSNINFIRPRLVKAVNTDGNILKYLLTTWKFSQGLRNNSSTCIIDFYVAFEFRSAFHSHLANLFFNELVRQMEGAFYEEAKRRYGKPSIKHRILEVSHRSITDQ